MPHGKVLLLLWLDLVNVLCDLNGGRKSLWTCDSCLAEGIPGSPEGQGPRSRAQAGGLTLDSRTHPSPSELQRKERHGGQDSSSGFYTLVACFRSPEGLEKPGTEHGPIL